MPKPMLKNPSQNERQESILSATSSKTDGKQQQMDEMKLDRLLRKPRSKEYMEAIHRLDAGGHVQNANVVQDIIHALQEEFPEVSLAGILLGYVSRCYLGPPYEVHSLDMTGQIIEHYPGGHTMPGGLERARSLAMRGGYEFIEVYSDCLRAVSANGSISVVKL